MVGELQDVLRAFAQGGHPEIDDVEAVEQVLPEVPLRTSSARLRLDVAMMRMSTGTGLPPPTRSITRSWMARRSLACRRTSISEISSSSRVPPVASSNLPMRRATAPVKAPFSWPNSSDFERGVRDGGAVDRDERLVRGSTRVHVAGDDLLADAALAGDQDGGLGPGDLVGQAHHALHGLVAEDDARGVARNRLQHGRDHLRIGRQGDVFRAPAWMARTAARASVPVPQATTGVRIRSASKAARDRAPRARRR